MQDRTTQYAADVLAGKIIAGDLVKLACKRHLDDIEKSKAAPYKYYFDVEQAERIIEFAETLTIAEGEEEEQVECYAFQCFILGNLNGWRTKTGGHRRFRTSYVQLGRQNGKSFLNGILAAYYGNFEKYKYGQIYCTATKKDQSLIVFNEIVKFIRSDPDLDECFNIHEHNSTIDCLLTHSKIKALSGDTKSIDGFRPYLGIVDEYHAHKNDQMYKLLEGGIKKMKSALISVITTAGFDLKSPYKTIQNAKKEAEKNGLSVWDEEGVKLYPLKVEVTDDVPDDAALEEKPDGSVNAYDENGEKVGEVPAEEVKEIMDEITVEDVEAAAAAARSEEEVHGTIRRVFDGRLRLRRRPSFEDDAICGVTMFDEKNVEKKAKIGDRVLYKTTDGYWISGDPEHTEFIPEE